MKKKTVFFFKFFSRQRGKNETTTYNGQGFALKVHDSPPGQRRCAIDEMMRYELPLFWRDFIGDDVQSLINLFKKKNNIKLKIKYSNFHFRRTLYARSTLFAHSNLLSFLVSFPLVFKRANAVDILSTTITYRKNNKTMSSIDSTIKWLITDEFGWRPLFFFFISLHYVAHTRRESKNILTSHVCVSLSLCVYRLHKIRIRQRKVKRPTKKMNRKKKKSLKF